MISSYVLIIALFLNSNFQGYAIKEWRQASRFCFKKIDMAGSSADVDASLSVDPTISDILLRNSPTRETADKFERKEQTPIHRVYTPRTVDNTNKVMSPSKQPFVARSGGPNYSVGVTLLQHPQLLVRFRVPKIKSDHKKELDKIQEFQKAQAETNSRDFGGRGGYSSSDSGRSYGSDSKDFVRFDPSSAFGDSKKSSKGKPGKESERKGADSNNEERQKSDRRSKQQDEDSEFDDDAEEEDIGDGVDYYGDEESLGLSSVPSSALREMETEGFSLDEMQLALYGEYGVKVSIHAIRKRMQDEKSEKKMKKKTGKTRRDRTKARIARNNPNVEKSVVLPDKNFMQVSELASLISIGSGEIVKHLMMNKGIMATMNQNIDMSVAREVVLAFGKSLASESVGDDEDEDDINDDEDDRSIDKVDRPPVVTIMGHVDHGKTTLLDTIRKTQVALGEAGGITQGISAFKVRTGNNQVVTFIDTPGHAAFSEMRKRGANVTDIVVLVVAADDGVMEQTKECIAAAKAARCPIVLAVNKIDKEGADVDNVLTSLMSYDILTEDFGGEVQCARVSAKNGVGVEELLEKVLLQAELMNLKISANAKPEGTVIESRIDKGLGVVITALVQRGTLRIGDYVLAGPSWGRVRRLISDQGEDLKEAGPSTPVQIVGLSNVPNAGDSFSVTPGEAEAREVAEARQRISRQTAGSVSNAAIFAQASGFADGSMDRREVIKVPIVIKADVSGSIEALRSSIEALQLSDDEAVCKADIVYAGVGDITSSDVAIAAVSKAKIVAFKVASGYNAMEDARASNVAISYYDVVYDLLDELESKIKTTLAPPPPGKLVGTAEVLKVFKLGKAGKVAGCKVIEGTIKLESQVRVMRGKRNPIYSGTFSSLRVVKDIVNEVPTGSECGASFEDFQDFEEGDTIECFVSGSGVASD